MAVESERTVVEHAALQTERKLAAITARTERVVLRGVQVVVLDELTPSQRVAICDAALAREAWLVEGASAGSIDAAIEAHAGKSGEAGCVPGQYRAVKKAAWLEKGPRVIEPPLA